LIVLREPWRPHPLAWIHRGEARSIADELGVACVSRLTPEIPLLRLSDPVMLEVTRTLTQASKPYLGPGAAAMERCYDKREALRIVAAAGIDCPATGTGSFPLIVKPRRGSDSIGLKVLRRGPIPARYRSDEYLLQEKVRGSELTVAVLHGRAGAPLRILLPEGRPYSFLRKYLLPARKEVLADGGLADRISETALRIAALLGVDWAARVDFIHEARSDRLFFLECDAAPLVGAASGFARSLAAGDVPRPAQLQLLTSGGKCS
jgi:D-alanine-D-alanine ligase-like ATP-grasp enzyme